MGEKVKDLIEDLKLKIYVLSTRIEKIERMFNPPVDTRNVGDWTSLETVEIGDTVGGVKIEFLSQRELIRATGRAIKSLSLFAHERKE